jgi:hypothetical protein
MDMVRSGNSEGFLNSHDQEKIIDSVNEKRAKESCQCYVRACRVLQWPRAVGRANFIYSMNRTVVVELVVPGGVSRRIDR